VGLAPGHLPELIYLLLGKPRTVGDPYSPVLHGVNGVLVADGIGIEAAVLPEGCVLSPYRRVLLVTHGVLDVPAA
jgi:hypothetical protein